MVGSTTRTLGLLINICIHRNMSIYRCVSNQPTLKRSCSAQAAMCPSRLDCVHCKGHMYKTYSARPVNPTYCCISPNACHRQDSWLINFCKRVSVFLSVRRKPRATLYKEPSILLNHRSHGQNPSRHTCTCTSSRLTKWNGFSSLSVGVCMLGLW